MPFHFRDLILEPLARLLSGVMFRRVEVAGLGNIPEEGSILVIANHENNLVDPMLLFACTGLRLRFLAKHTLFSHPLVKPLVNLVNAVPVYRREDGARPGRNDRTIELCARILLGGDVICVFPEGACHNEPMRRPLKTGAARIALKAAGREPERPVRVLPIGLYYSAKSRFRSAAAVVIGEPIAVQADQTAHALKEAMALGLARVTLNAPSWEQSRRALRLAEVRAGALEVAPGPLERFKRHGEALASLEQREASDPIPITRSWDELPESKPSLARALLLTPLALVGVGLTGLPLALMLHLAQEGSRTPDEPATRRLIGAFLFFPPVVVAQSLVIGWTAGGFAGTAAFLAAPVALFATLFGVDAWRDVLRSHRPRILAPLTPVP
jgi:1-acyl-sn-glycerol-3-phosphate acyltransferase